MALFKSQQQGFTLVEVSIVMTLMVGFLVMMAPYYTQAIERGQIEQAAERARIVYEAALTYRRDMNAWPGNTNLLVSTNYLSASHAVDPWGGAITLVPSGNDVLLRMVTPEERFTNAIAAKLPGPSVIGTILTETIVRPGWEASNDALYARDGSRPLAGAMNANNQNINAINTATGRRFTATTDMRAPVYYDSNNETYKGDFSGTSTMNRIDAVVLKLTNNVVEGNACETKDVGTTASGALLSCVNSRWTAPGGGGDVDYGGSYLQRLTISGSVSCFKANIVTNACRCPDGFATQKVSQGGYWHDYQWSHTYHGFNCEKKI